MKTVVSLCYNLNDQLLYVLNTYKRDSEESNKLFQRELNQFISKSIGTIDKEQNKYLVLECIEGETLRDFIIKNEIDEKHKL